MSSGELTQVVANAFGRRDPNSLNLLEERSPITFVALRLLHADKKNTYVDNLYAVLKVGRMITHGAVGGGGGGGGLNFS